MPTKTYHLKGIGDVAFTKYRQSRVIRLSISGDGAIRVSMPYKTNYQDAIDFVFSKEAWIANAKIHIQKKVPPKTVFNHDDEFSTHFHKLILIPEERKNIEIAMNEGQIHFIYPIHKDIEDPEIQEAIKSAVISALRIEAKFYLPRRVGELAKQFNFNYESVSVRNARTRWGSCSGINNINLNIHLMRLPSHLIDYVILHELCHTVHKNHGKDFWSLLDKVSGNAKGLDRELKKHRTFL